MNQFNKQKKRINHRLRSRVIDRLNEIYFYWWDNEEKKLIVEKQQVFKNEKDR